MLSRRRAGAGSDGGMTLVELVVGMTLMVIVSALALNFFVGTMTQANRVVEQSLTSGSPRAAVTQIAKTLQVADSSVTPGAYANRFVVFTGVELGFYANISPVSRSGLASRTSPSYVDFKLSSGKLTESVTPGGSTVTSTNVLVSDITNATIFTYCTDATDPSVLCTAASSSNSGSVAMVLVAMTVQHLRNTTAQTIQTGIAISGQVTS